MSWLNAYESLLIDIVARERLADLQSTIEPVSANTDTPGDTFGDCDVYGFDLIPVMKGGEAR